MRIETGQTRIAFIGKWLTLKSALIPKHLFEDAKAFIRRDNSVESADPRFTSLTKVCINANTVERAFSKHLRDIVVPTKFSLLGLFNIQSTAEPIRQFNDNDLEVMRRIWGEKIRVSTHTFLEDNNYGIHRGRLKLIDYGNEKVVKLLMDNKILFREMLDAIQKSLEENS